jgi:LuxR family quorum sensing-dependent transcriptional regulator
MPSLQLNGSTRSKADASARNRDPADLEAELMGYCHGVTALRMPQEVVDALHQVTSRSYLSLNVMGAARLPLKSNDWDAMRLGHSVFLHQDVPAGWWDEYAALASMRFTPALYLARSCLASYTWTEIMRTFEPIGVDRWGFELALKYGMRDGFTCPVGGRWVVAFWCKRDLSNLLAPASRILLQTASSFAAQRLERLAGPDVKRIGSRSRLTPRELAVLRLVASGGQASEIAKALGLGEETVRSHLKKAQAKLGARNRTQAACEALRQNLIP